MAKTKISEYSSTANSNTDIASINIDEGCAPSGINNAIRALMAQIHDLYAGTTGDTWPVAGGGTGSGTASGARTNLGLAIGTDVQAFNAALAAIATNNGTNMMKNRIINGAMMIDQRNAGASVTPSADDQYVTDRFKVQSSAIRSNTSWQQVDVPSALAGFNKAIKFTANSASTIGSSDFYAIGQVVEGYNWADLGWGTANAKSATFTCWVYGSITGTFSGLIKNYGQSRAYPFLYTISSANTWTQVSVTIPGDTSGTYATANTGGVWIELSLACGSTYLGTPSAWNAGVYVGATGQSNAYLTTSGATFYTTGWQLEKGSTATSFDYRPYGTELALCQRYFQKTYNPDDVPGAATQSGVVGRNTDATGSYVSLQAPFKVTMRASPTVVLYNPVTGVVNSIRGDSSNLAGAVSRVGANGCYVFVNNVSVAGGTEITAHITASAEL